MKRKNIIEEMEEITHFSHEDHPLKLVDLETIVGASFNNGSGGDGDEKSEIIGCYACEKPISHAFAYGCIQCRYFLHKACAQLPPSINHPSLYEHPLTLVDSGTTRFTSWICDVCRTQNKIAGFCYSFSKQGNDLWFTACIDCCIVEIASKSEADAIKKEAMIKVKHEGHPQHTLTLQLRHGSFRCDACNSKEEGLFYRCDSCDFWIHKTCFSLNPTIHLPHHPNHPLTLVFSLPENFTNFFYYCEFCNKYIRRNVWLYHCANCRYFAHIKCALNAEQPSIPREGPSTSVVDEVVKDLLQFPLKDPFTDPLKLLYSNKIVEDDVKTVEINHWSHSHPLTLNVEPQANMTDITCSDLIEVCEGCVRALSLPYYICKYGCSFTLHKYCAELPLKLEHRLHLDHSLSLVDSYTHRPFYKCNGCFSYGNKFAYICETCNFYLDVNYAFLPNTIQHISHKHPLIQYFNPKSLCKACDTLFEGMIYACKACSFHLDLSCAVNSPCTIAHRYCKGHEIPLTYPPVENHLEDFYCDICETEMHPKLPLYYCQKCKNSFHLDCISRFDYQGNMFYEGTMTVSYHKHRLTFSRRKKTPKYVCSDCNCDINGYLILECRARVCNFSICLNCHNGKI